MKNAILFCMIAFALLGCKTTRSDVEEAFNEIYYAQKDKIVHLMTSSGAGTGFLTTEGYIVTAYHVVDTATSVGMRYKNIKYYLKACYKDHANDIAVLYPIAGEGIGGNMQDIAYDTLQNDTHVTVQSVILNAEEPLMLLGFPYGLYEQKRIWGTYKYRKEHDMITNVYHYACDLPPIRGCSGGPVFKQGGDFVGVAVEFEDAPTDTPYLVTHVVPAETVESLLAHITDTYMDKLIETKDNIPGFSISDLEDLDPDNLTSTNMYNADDGYGFLLTKLKDKEYAEIVYEADVPAVNIFLNALIKKPIDEEEGDAYFEIAYKYVDEDNYLAVRMDATTYSFDIVYVVEGEERVVSPFIDMPILPSSVYNVEIFTEGKKVGVYFDNIPVFYDHELPIQSGSVRYLVTENCIAKMQTGSTLGIRIPSE